MTERLLLCTDLDRTLIPNGPQSESPNARERFATLVAHPDVTLVYVTGRHRALIDQAITYYRLPLPDFVIGDVGTTIYRLGPQREWRRQVEWEREIARDWGGRRHAEIKSLLVDVPALRLQETARQNDYKVSYYVPLHNDRHTLSRQIDQRLKENGAAARLVWSIDEPTGVGLLDVLPARASKYHAIEALMATCDFRYIDTLFSGDSGNDIEVLASPVPAVLVANSQPPVRGLAQRLAEQGGNGEQLYLAQGGFMGMNGNYSAGILEGVAHFHPDTIGWMGFPAEQQP